MGLSGVRGGYGEWRCFRRVARGQVEEVQQEGCVSAVSSSLQPADREYNINTKHYSVTMGGE